MNSEAYDAPDLRDYVRVVRQRGWILLLCVILIPLAAYEYTQTKPKLFQSSTILQIQSGVDTSLLNNPDFSPAAANLDLVAAIVSTTAVSNAAAKELGLPPGSLQGAASANADPDTGFLTITATGATAPRASATATAFANALTTTRAKEGTQRVDAALATAQKSLQATPKRDVAGRSQIQAQIQRLQTLKQAQAQNAQVIEPARGAAQIAPHPRRNATVGLILALLVGAALVALAERLDRRLHKPEEIEKLSDVPFLATIPREAFPGGDKGAGVHESFQTLRNTLTYFNADEPLKTLLVTSALKGEGKTMVATNLASAYASAGQRVIIIDADLRKPEAAQRLGVDQPIGLSEVLSGRVAVGDALREVEPFGSGLRVLAGGAVPPNPSALLGSLRMESLLSELHADSDILIVDSTPLLLVSDALPLLDKASGIVMLARLDKTPRDAVRRTLQMIENAGGQILGIVATGGKYGVSGSYGYGYGDYGEKPPATAPTAGAGPAAAAGTNGSAPEQAHQPQA